MNQEALSMSKLLIGCVTRGDVNGQYHWAKLLELDARARGAKGPERHDCEAAWNHAFNAIPSEDARPGAMSTEELSKCRLDTEDAIEEARR